MFLTPPVLKIAAAFKASHQVRPSFAHLSYLILTILAIVQFTQDTWEAEDKRKFNEEQLSALNGILSGTSYYA